MTLDRIFDSADFNPEKTPALRWRKRGSGYVTLEATKGGQHLVGHDPATGLSEILVPDHWLIPAGESRPLAIEGYDFSEDGARLLIFTNSKRVWRVNSRGDYWVLDLSTRQLKKLGGDIPPSTTMFATFSPDGKCVAYVHKNNLYAQELLDFSITRLTRDGSETIINGTFDWVYEEELGLRNGFRWSPDSRSIAYWQLDSGGVKEFHITNSSDGPYARLISIRYPKTGEKNSAARIGVVGARGGETTWLGLNNIPDEPREHYLAKMEWQGDQVAVQQFNRLQNSNRVLHVNPAHGGVRTFLEEKDAAWVENDNDFRWIDNGKHLVWLSERDGWRHVYLVSPASLKATQITKGAFDVIEIEAIDEKGGWLYFLASPDNPTQRYLYRVSLKGGASERVTPADLPGTHTYSISADAQWAVHTYSTFTRPPVTTLIHLPDHKVVKTFADNAALKKKLDALRLGPSEFFRINIEEDVALDGWCIKPPGFDAAKKYPVLFYVYGEPAGQTVLDRWDGNRFLWHNMLAQQGYLVMSVDNRGTPAPRGRAWRKSIYRQVGILASADQAAAVRALLKQRPYMDPARIAIWGWSGGGSMSLNAIFRYPDLYQTAMAIAPVPNQRHYDTIYQERYMGLPADNVEGYRKGSPIHFAHQLKGNLFIAHGTGDDNCHYLGVETLIDELITHNKQFTMLAYPNRSHGINEGRNTTRHLFESLTRYLRTHTPPEPVRPPTAHSTRKIEGWTVRIDDRLLQAPDDEIGNKALRFLENKLADITVVVPKSRVKKLQEVTIVLDLSHGKLTAMQYHPSAGWLKANGYSTDLAKCVHLPRAADLPTKRNINEQPWVILHELAHAYHDQVLGFDHPRIREAFENYKKSGRGDKTLLFNGKRVRHYALTNEKEFFAEMTEAYFGVNDFFPFTRAELLESEPEIYALLRDIWESP